MYIYICTHILFIYMCVCVCVCVRVCVCVCTYKCIYMDECIPRTHAHARRCTFNLPGFVYKSTVSVDIVFY